MIFVIIYFLMIVTYCIIYIIQRKKELVELESLTVILIYLSFLYAFGIFMPIYTWNEAHISQTIKIFSLIVTPLSIIIITILTLKIKIEINNINYTEILKKIAYFISVSTLIISLIYFSIMSLAKKDYKSFLESLFYLFVMISMTMPTYDYIFNRTLGSYDTKNLLRKLMPIIGFFIIFYIGFQMIFN